MMAVLNRMLFNVDPNKAGMAAFNIGSSNLMSFNQLKQVSSTEIKSLLGPGKTIRTLDTETTSVFKGAQVRQMSIVEMVNGNITKVSDAYNINFASPQLAGMTVMGKNNAAQTMSNFIQGTYKTGMNIEAQGQFLDEATKYLNHLLDADVVAGHNIFFDLNTLSGTIKQMQGYSGHKGAQEAIARLHGALEQDGKIVDTLEYARGYLNDQVNSLLAAQNIGDETQRLEKFRELLMSNEFLAKVRAGGSAPYASMEAISLNTNLLDLLYEEGLAGDTGAQELFERIFQGSHIADTDAALQTYMTKYMINQDPQNPSENMLKVVKNSGSRRAEVKIAQEAINRSAAVTLTTNISDIDNISDPIFDYIRNSQLGKQGVVLNLEAGVLGQQEGILQFDPSKGQYTFSTSSANVPISTSRAEAVIQDTLDNARYGQQESFNLGFGGQNINITNKYGRRISQLPVNYTQAHQVNELLHINRQLSAKPITPLTEEALLENIGLTYKQFGGNMGFADMMKVASGISPSGSSFSIGLSNYGLPINADPTTMMNAAARYALARRSMGNAYSGLDVRSSVFSTILSEATSKNALSARDAIVRQIASSEDPVQKRILEDQLQTLKYAQYQDVLPELGISHFRTQKDIRLISEIGDDSPRFYNRMFMPTEFLNAAAEKTFGTPDAFRMGNLSLSFANTPDGTNRVNLFWKLGSDIDKTTKRKFITNIYDHLQDTVQAMTAEQSTSEANIKLFEQTTALKQLESKHGKQKVIDFMLEEFEKGGFGYATEQGQVADTLMRSLDQLGYEVTNEGIALANMQAGAIDVVDDVVRVGAFADERVLEIAGYSDSQAGRQALRDAGQEQIRSANEIAQVIEEKNIYSKLKTKITRSKLNRNSNKVLDFYINHKSSIRNTALGLMGAGIGYYLFKNYQENKVYDETVEQQPMDSPRFNEPAIVRNPGLNSYRRDPLVTAGVVGNLDRNKIGHTQMGPNKYNHLYGN